MEAAAAAAPLLVVCYRQLSETLNSGASELIYIFFGVYDLET